MMAIKTNFMKLWHEKEGRENRRISLTDISDGSGIGWSTASRWKNEDVKRFDADVLSALCAYFHCEVGDLLEYVPDKD